MGEAPGRRNGAPLDSAAFSAKLPALRGFTRVNVLDSYPGRDGKGALFPEREAWRGAIYLDRKTPKDRAMIFMGARVAWAFGMLRRDFRWCEWRTWRGRRVAVVPHPSGIVRWWNDPKNRELAATFLADALKMGEDTRHQKKWEDTGQSESA